jgi:putative spermidine/putrescine transport system permease protein
MTRLFSDSPFRQGGVAALFLLPAALLLIVFLVLPLCATIWLSLSPNSLVHFPGHGLGNYAYLGSKPYYLGVAWRTLRLALATTLASLLLGYPAALVLRGESAGTSGAVTLAMTLPVLAGPLVVVLGWMILLSNGGPLLHPLAQWGVIGRLRLLGSETGIAIGIVHFVLPFVVLSLVSVLRGIPDHLIEAARSLGASPWQRFTRITFPLALPGLISATIIALSLSMSSFIAPHYLGGPADLTLTTLVSQFVLATYNGQLAAAVSVLLLMLMSALVFLLTAGVARWVRA